MADLEADADFRSGPLPAAAPADVQEVLTAILLSLPTSAFAEPTAAAKRASARAITASANSLLRSKRSASGSPRISKAAGGVLPTAAGAQKAEGGDCCVIS